MEKRLTDECWRNLDPWECCGQDKYCNRGCHEKGGCANGCIVPKIYAKLAELEDRQKNEKTAKNIADKYAECDQFVCSRCGTEIQGWTRIERDDETDEEFHYLYTFKYCPQCGAKMDGDAE